MILDCAVKVPKQAPDSDSIFSHFVSQSQSRTVLKVAGATPVKWLHGSSDESWETHTWRVRCNEEVATALTLLCERVDRSRDALLKEKEKMLLAELAKVQKELYGT